MPVIMNSVTVIRLRERERVRSEHCLLAGGNFSMASRNSSGYLLNRNVYIYMDYGGSSLKS